MIARIIKAKVCVICRSQSLSWITQTKALIVVAIMRKLNPTIVLLCIYLSSCKKRLNLDAKSAIAKLFKVLVRMLGEATSACNYIL